MHDWRDVGKELCRKGGMQDRRDTVLNRKDTVQEVQDRRDSGMEGFRTGGMQDRRDSGQKGVRIGGMQGRWDAGQEGRRL